MSAASETLANVFHEFAFVSAILGGAALGSLMAWINNPWPESPLRGWAAGFSVAATACLTVCVVGWSMMSTGVRVTAASTSAAYDSLHFWLSLSFLTGIMLFLVGLALGGWVFSRKLGIVSTIVVAVSTIALVIIMSNFVS